jgi:hypothetical protein
VKDSKENIMRQTKQTKGTDIEPKQVEKVHEVIKSNGGNSINQNTTGNN